MYSLDNIEYKGHVWRAKLSQCTGTGLANLAHINNAARDSFFEASSPPPLFPLLQQLRVVVVLSGGVE